MSNQQLQKSGLCKDMENLLQLHLSMPISVASSERSFSVLRRLKTWLRNTVTQKGLTHLALLHMHQEILDSLNIHVLKREFISTTQRAQPPLVSYRLLKVGKCFISPVLYMLTCLVLVGHNNVYCWRLSGPTSLS